MMRRLNGIGLVAPMLLMLSGVTGLPAQTQLDLPPIPEDFGFLQDYAGILGPETRIEVGMVQKEAFERHRTPIVVVTITHKGRYGGRNHSIEDFAREWFDHWEIGYAGPRGDFANQGILFLVSPGDRAARIELGADWGTSWDSYAQYVMDERIVPAFRQRDFDSGVVEAAWALLGMAAKGPDGAAPGRVNRFLHSLGGRVFAHTPLPVWLNLLVLAIGLALIAQSFRQETNRKTLRLAGAILVVGAVVFWVLLIVLGVIFHSRFEGGSGGYSSSGGFGGGGFSGGGGATGRW